MNFFQITFLSIIEGFTEFLPISSTAHLILASRILKLSETDFLKSFTVIIQFGAILAVIFLYFRRLVHDWNANLKIITAFLPTAFVGFTFYRLIKGFLFENQYVIIYALFFGGIALIIFERFYKGRAPSIKDLGQLSYKKSFLIGCAQALSIVPGVSRAASTILGGMLLGVKREAIVEFSFLLSIPTMFAAATYDLWKNVDKFSADHFSALTIGFILSFAFALFGVKFLIHYIQRHSFYVFGIYRIIISILFLFYIIYIF